MSITFPNPSRSYDDRNDWVRFVGHDGMFQISFSIAAAALSKKIARQLSTEEDFLSAFDAERPSIETIASKAYSQTRKSSYAFTADDI